MNASAARGNRFRLGGSGSARHIPLGRTNTDSASAELEAIGSEGSLGGEAAL
jgi:hypothetical protein